MNNYDRDHYREYYGNYRPGRRRGYASDSGMWRDAWGTELDDRYIKRLVIWNLYRDGWVDADRIDVEVDDQVVTLRGEVDDYLESRYAWDDAWEATGVRGVLNQLTVSSDLVNDDARADDARATEAPAPLDLT